MFLANKLNKGSGSAAPDAQFNYVTMLLHGDGTNGAQNNTFVDSSTNNFTITRNGNTTQGSFSPYGSNWSNYFGSGNRLALPNNSCVVGANDFTLEAWVNPDSFSAYSSIFNSQTNASTAAGSSYGIAINQTTGTLQSYWYVGSTTYDISSSGAVPLGQWSHVALARTGGTVSLFLNGTKVATNTSMSTNSINDGATNFPPAIGYNGNGFAFLGYISNFRILVGSGGYNATSSTITVPTARLTAVTNTVVLSCQSNRFIDNSTNAFTVTPAGTPSVQRFNPFGTSTAYSTSVIGGSGFFNGNSGTYLTAPSTSGQLGAGDFTVECWSYPISRISLYPCFWSNYTSFGTGSIAIFAGHGSSSATKYQVAISGTFPAIESTASIIYNQWTHIALVRSGSTITLYINGVANGTFTSSATMNGTSGISYIGSTGDDLVGAYLNGYLSNQRVVVGTAVYTSAFTPPTAPVTAITNTRLLLDYTNGAIFDNAMMNDLQTVGNAQISTSVKKYGTGSLAFDGTGDYLFAPNIAANSFRTSNYTLEFWVYATSWSTTPVLLEYGRPTTGNSPGLEFYISTTGGKLDVYGGPITGSLIASYSSISTTTWTHVALTRASGTTRLFINGTQSGSSVDDTTDYTQAGVFIGAYINGTLSLNGYIDDLRVTKGYARYTANFTAPTAAFSDTGPI
jgi:hypothetical protein